MTTVPSVALIGATGHGAWHLRAMDPLHRSGRLRLAAVCDVRPVVAAPDAPLPAGVTVHTDHVEMLAAVRPDVVVVCTPPHTHLAIATDVLRAGADLLLEKPPTPTLDEHLRLAGVVEETGRACQVGFQALGSPALAELLTAVRDGRLGAVTGVSAAGARQRTDGYYARSRWAGKREVDGRPSADGALANVFAHAVMNCFAVVAAAGGDPTPAVIEAERYRCRDIEVEDTAALRLIPRSGPPIVVAVTLCAGEDIDGEILVHTESGSAELGYTTDRLRLPGETSTREITGRLSLLENLLDHRADPTVALLAALDRTEPFTRWLDAMRGMPLPADVAQTHRSAHGDGRDRRIEITDINKVVRAAADRMSLFSEIGDVAWAVPPVRLEGPAPTS